MCDQVSDQQQVQTSSGEDYIPLVQPKSVPQTHFKALGKLHTQKSSVREGPLVISVSVASVRCHVESLSDGSGIHLHQKCIMNPLLLLLHARIMTDLYSSVCRFIFTPLMFILS